MTLFQVREIIYIVVILAMACAIMYLDNKVDQILVEQGCLRVVTERATEQEPSMKKLRENIDLN